MLNLSKNLASQFISDVKSNSKNVSTISQFVTNVRFYDIFEGWVICIEDS